MKAKETDLIESGCIWSQTVCRDALGRNRL